MQILVVAGLVEGIAEERLVPLGKEEALKAWEFYAAGRLRWVASRTDKRGIVGFFEAAGLAKGAAWIESPSTMYRAGFDSAQM